MGINPAALILLRASHCNGVRRTASMRINPATCLRPKAIEEIPNLGRRLKHRSSGSGLGETAFPLPGFPCLDRRRQQKAQERRNHHSPD
jgi:hypothetical protein